MFRSGLKSSPIAVLTRRVTSSKKKEGAHFIRHFVSTDAISSSSEERKTVQATSVSRSHDAMPLSAILGVSMAHQHFYGKISGNMTLGKRNFSSISEKITSCAASSPEAEMATFEQSAAAAEATTAATEASAPWEPTWWPQDQILDLIINLHESTGVNYAFTVGALTLAFRTLMFPLFVKSQQNSSRMAHMKPEMDIIQERMKVLDKKDMDGQQKLAKQMQGLFRKYDCNPLKSLMIIPIQMPVFMGTFFALKQFPEIFPEKLIDQGILWFPDLSVPDPYGILPITSALSFLLMMELGKKQMMATNPAQGQMMLNFFRGIAVVMIPATWNFASVVFCYWTANNAFSIGQSVAFNNQTVRKSLGIWDPPKPVPGGPPPKGMKEMFDDMMTKKRNESDTSNFKDKITMHNAAVDRKNSDRTDTGPGRKRRNKRGKN